MWHYIIQDVPFRVLKGCSSGYFQYPSDKDFYDEGKFSDDDMFEDDNLPSESCHPSETQARPVKPDKESLDVEKNTFSPEPEISLSARMASDFNTRNIDMVSMEKKTSFPLLGVRNLYTDTFASSHKIVLQGGHA